MTLDLCKVYVDYAPDKRRVLRLVLPFYVSKLMQEGDYSTALQVLSNAYKKGLLTPSLQKLYDQLVWLKKLVDATNKLLDVEQDIMNKVSNGSVSMYDLDSLNKAIREFGSVLGGAVGKGLDLGEFSHKMNEALDLYALLQRLLMIKDEEKAIERILNSLAKPNPTPEDYESAANKLLEAYRHAVKIRDFIDNTMLLTDTYRSFLDSLKKTARSVETQLIALVTLFKQTAKALRHVYKLNDLLSKYGGDNNLMNPTYVGSVYNAILDVMADILGARMCENDRYCTYGNSKIAEIYDNLASTLTKYLNTLKVDLAGVDKRWLDLFNKAESHGGVHLINVTVNEGFTGKMEELVKEARESALNLMHSSSLWKQVWGTVAMIGAGALSSIEMMLNPREFVKSIEDMIKGLYHAGEEIVNGNLEKVKREAREIAYSMAGTPENLAFTVGTILAFEMGGKVAGKLPLSTRLRAVMERLGSGDPFGAVYVLMKDPKIVSAFREAVEFLPRNTEAWERIMRSYKESITSRITERLVERSAKSIVRENAPLLRKIIAGIVVKPDEFLKLDKAVKEAVMKIGIGKALETAKRYHNVLVDLVNRANGTLVEILKANEIKGVRIPSELKTYAMVEQLKKALPDMTRSLDEVLKMKSEVEKLLEDLKPFMNEDEWMRLKQELKSADMSLAEAGVSRAKSILDMIREELSKGGEIKTTLYRLADKLEEAGLKDLAVKVRRGDLEALYDAIKNNAIKLDRQTAYIYDTLRKVASELEKNKLLNKTMRELLNRIDELTVTAVDKAPLAGLSDRISRIISYLKEKGVYNELGTGIREIEERARRGESSLEDLVKLSELVANKSARLASVIDMGTVTSLIDSAVKYARDMLKDTPVYKYLEGDLDKIVEIESQIGKASRTVARTLEEINTSIRDSLYKLADYVENIDSKVAENLRESVDEFLEAVNKGSKEEVLKASEKLYEALRKAERVGGGLTAKLRDALAGLKNELLGKLGFKNKVLEDVYRRLGKYIEEDLRELPEVPEGWGYIITSAGRHRFVPVLGKLSELKKIRELLSKKHVDRVVGIGDKEFHWARDINILPDGTMEVLYRIESPEGSWLEYRYVVKPKSMSEADIYTYTRYDPRLIQELAKDKTAMEALEHELETGDIIRMVDPDFDLLKSIAIMKRGTLESIARILVEGVKQSLPVILAGAEINKLPLPWKVALSSSKIELLEDLKPYMQRVTSEVKTALEKLGLEPIGEASIGGYKFIVVEPLDYENIFKRFMVVNMNGKKIVVPVVTINGEDYIVIPNIQLNLGLNLSENELLAMLQKQGYNTEEITFNPPSKGGARGEAVTAPVKPMLPIPVAVGKQAQTGRGTQYEILML